MHKLRLAQCNKRFYGICKPVCYILNGKVVYNCQAVRDKKAAEANIVYRASQNNLRLQYVCEGENPLTYKLKAKGANS